MTMKAFLFEPGAQAGVPVDVRTMDYGDGLEPCLDWFYETLGCSLVEVVPLSMGDLWVDEEGKAKGLAVNEGASALALGEISRGDCIVGKAIFFPRE